MNLPIKNEFADKKLKFVFVDIFGPVRGMFSLKSVTLDSQNVILHLGSA